MIPQWIIITQIDLFAADLGNFPRNDKQNNLTSINWTYINKVS
jgi:hypothetical protein